MSSELDETDLRLLGLLQRDGLQSMAELSKAIGVAPSTLNDRVKRLGRLGAITGTHAAIDPVALGLNLLAFVFVGWSDGNVEADFLKRIAAADQVLECHHVTGAWNYLLKVAGQGHAGAGAVPGHGAEAGQRAAAHRNDDRAQLA